MGCQPQYHSAFDRKRTSPYLVDFQFWKSHTTINTILRHAMPACAYFISETNFSSSRYSAAQ